MNDDLFRPVARTAADILAVIPHTLGVWPQHCVVVMATTENSMGPCVRVHVPAQEDMDDPEFAAAWVLQMAQLLEHADPGSSLFVAVCLEGPSASSLARTAQQRAQRLTLCMAEAAMEAGLLAGHTLLGAWCIQGTQWWSVTEPTQIYHVEQIRTSCLYTAMVCDGSVVQADVADRLQPVFLAEGMWPQGRLSALPTQTHWRVEYLERWRTVLTSFRDGVPTTPGDPQELTELMIGCVEPTGADLILVMALVGNDQLSREAWDERSIGCSRTPSPASGRISQVMLGEWEGEPHWETVDRCSIVLERLISVAESAPHLAKTPEVLTILAALWVARGHLERFRARGSLTHFCLERAEQLADGYAGVDRLRRLCAAYPVPGWATERGTAWQHRKVF
ncbi:MAG: DUF4192 family protein [Kocuria sp.]|nr:DUF4192 family protein [Kocuria sp.]